MSLVTHIVLPRRHDQQELVSCIVAGTNKGSSPRSSRLAAPACAGREPRPERHVGRCRCWQMQVDTIGYALHNRPIQIVLAAARCFDGDREGSRRNKATAGGRRKCASAKQTQRARRRASVAARSPGRIGRRIDRIESAKQSQPEPEPSGPFLRRQDQGHVGGFAVGETKPPRPRSALATSATNSHLGKIYKTN